MSGLLDAARAWLSARQLAVVVEVTEVRGSVPREAGTRMLVSATQVLGTVGGGHLELKAIQEARQMLATALPVPRLVHYPLGPALGQCCGGAMTLAFESLSESAVARWADMPPRFHLQLYGAGHVGRAIARLLATLNVRVDWIDEREDEFPAALHEGAWPAHITKLAVDAVETEVCHAPPGAFYLVLTHNHDLDMRITEAILKRGDFGFLGLIGSRSKKQRFVHRFIERGIAASAIDRLVCPIGLPGITGKEPEVIAVGAVAQLLQRSNNPGA
ncbi:MAG TPA: xanthine dehydrogenase accessory protein XdhC [Rhizobacter sp.]|nr:xanthine dehydrogenase accessory protein XdhC [Rhizobacter sp.]